MCMLIKVRMICVLSDPTLLGQRVLNIVPQTVSIPVCVWKLMGFSVYLVSVLIYHGLWTNYTEEQTFNMMGTLQGGFSC